jgi:signal transduction histidine kinase
VTPMKRWRQAFVRIGGPDAVTWPAFWVTFIGSLTGNLTTGGAISTPLAVRILVIAVTQVAMFIPLVLLRLTLLRNPPKPRPWIAMLGFLIACVVRGVVLSTLLVSVRAVTEPLYGYRIIASIIGTGLLLLLTALVVSSMRAHTRSLRQLVLVQRDLAQAQERIVTEVTERNEEALARVKARLTEELGALESMSGVSSVTELQRLANDVVRPMSHELASSLPAWEAPKSDVDSVHVTWQQAVGQMARTSAFQPVLSALLMSMLLFVTAIGLYGMVGIQLMVVVGVSLLVLSWLANRLLSLILPQLSPGPGFALLIVASLVVGFLSATLGNQVLGEASMISTFAIAGGIYIAVLIFIVALVSAIIRQQRASEEMLNDFTEQLRREVVRLRQAQWLQRKALSRALHGPVQAAVMSAALRLDVAVREGQPTNELIGDIREQLRSVVDVLETDESTTISIDVALQRIIGTWEGVCSIDANVTQGAIDQATMDPIAMSTMIDILTEGVSNAVRHAQATHVRINVDRDEDGDLALTVIDNGMSEDHPATSTGLGTVLLDECTLTWSRRVEGGAYVLRAKIPAGRPPMSEARQHQSLD